MKKIKNLAIISLLFLAFSCSNKVDKYTSMVDDFVDKWEEKVNSGKLSADEIAEIRKDDDKIGYAEDAAWESKSELSAEQLEELDNTSSKHHKIINNFHNNYGYE